MNRVAALDGLTEANRGTWSRLTRLHVASAGLPMRTSFIAETDGQRGDAIAS